MTPSYAGWLTWAASYEPTALTGFAGDQISLDSYKEAEEACAGISVGDYTFMLMIYKMALHNFIIQSNLESAPPSTLYEKYSVATNLTLGILQSGSDAGTSSSRVIPDKVQSGDMATMLLWATPYGRWCESIFEQIGAVFAAVVK